MNDRTDLKLAKWPFFLGDVFLIGLAAFIYLQGRQPVGHWEVAFVLVCCVVGAGLSVTPYLLEYQALVRLSEARSLVSAADQMRNLESVAAQISSATAHWQTVQEQSDKTAVTAKQIAERMSAEAAAFSDFLKKANDTERANLRLEVDKFRRAEKDWLQAVVRLLDHVYALHQAAMRSGQPGLVEQLGNFQVACRDVARRLGIIPFTPAQNEPFNAEMHQLIEGHEPPSPAAKVIETIATGFTFQGKLVRPALVTLEPEIPAGDIVPETAPAGGEPVVQSRGEALQEQSLL